MAGDIPDDVREGDALEPWMLNAVFAELRRWRKLSASGAASVSGADSAQPPNLHAEPDVVTFIQLTGAYSGGYPWKEVVFSPGRAVVETGVTGTAAGDPAFERQTGDTTLTADGTVYEARRAAGSNQLCFDGKN